jgi:hypothetical protein
VESTRGIDDHDVTSPRAPGLDGIERDGGGIAARRSADEVGSGPLGPDLELLLRCCPERVARAD